MKAPGVLPAVVWRVGGGAPVPAAVSVASHEPAALRTPVS